MKEALTVKEKIVISICLLVIKAMNGYSSAYDKEIEAIKNLLKE